MSNIEIVRPRSPGAVAGEIQRVTIRGEMRALLAIGGVDPGPQVLWSTPGVINGGPL
jgi:hypothetical protein